MRNRTTINLLAIIVTLFMASSCATTRTTKTAKELSTDGKLYQNATLSDVEVGQKVSKTMTFNYGSGSQTSIALRKLSDEVDVVTSELLSENGGDILVERRHSVTVKSKLLKLSSTVTVEGYVGSYKNFRALTPADSTLLEVNNMADGKYRNSGSKSSNIVIY